MNKLRYILPLVILMGMLLIPGLELFAQGPPEDCCPTILMPACGHLLPECEPVPLDGGLSALLLAGVAYGAKRFYGKAK